MSIYPSGDTKSVFTGRTSQIHMLVHGKQDWLCDDAVGFGFTKFSFNFAG